jgi:hypothetical protein
VQDKLGKGHYWRMSHEILLTAVRSEDDRFDDQSLRSSIEAPRARHSEKPDVVRELIERASPGPRLELFGRSLHPNWHVWGHEIAEPLTEQAASFHQPGESAVWEIDAADPGPRLEVFARLTGTEYDMAWFLRSACLKRKCV